MTLTPAERYYHPSPFKRFPCGTKIVKTFFDFDVVPSQPNGDPKIRYWILRLYNGLFFSNEFRPIAFSEKYKIVTVCMGMVLED